MIRFSADANGRFIIGIGLSRENCKRLLEGKPIAIDMAEMGGKGELLIMAGETEQAMYDELRKAGVLGPETKIKSDLPQA